MCMCIVRIATGEGGNAVAETTYHSSMGLVKPVLEGILVPFVIGKLRQHGRVIPFITHILQAVNDVLCNNPSRGNEVVEEQPQKTTQLQIQHARRVED